MMRHVALREYARAVLFNGRTLKRVLISDHYEENHSEHMNDGLILKLIGVIRGEDVHPEAALSDGYEIFVVDNVFYEEKRYKLVLTLHPDKDYLGVINAFRRSGK